MAVIKWKVPYWYEVPHLFVSKKEYYGQVQLLKITDGDTFVCMCNGHKIRVRLLGIDAPEMNQVFGTDARQVLISIMQNENICLYQTSTGKYGRTIAMVYAGFTCVNEEMIVRGAAWVYDKYCPASRFEKWHSFQDHAKRNNFGLWAFPNPVPPEEWRSR